MGKKQSSRTPWYRALCGCTIALAVFGCKSGVTVDVTDSSGGGGTSSGTTVQISGSVQLPAQLSVAVAQKSVKGKKRAVVQKRVLSKADTAPTEATTVELIDSEGHVLDTTTAAADGSYAFTPDETDIADANNSAYDTCYIRSTTGDIVEIATLSLPAESVTADTADSAFDNSDVDSSSTFATLMEYAGTDYNPLTADDGDAPPDVHMATSSDVVDALVARAEDVLNDTTDFSTLGGSMDESMAAMLATLRALDQVDVEGMSVEEAQYALMSLSGSSDPDAATIGAAISGSGLLTGIDTSDLTAGADTLISLDDVVDAWTDNAAFVDALEGNPDAMDLFVGASITGKTVTEFESMNATDDLLDAQLGLLDNLHLDQLGDIDPTALFESFSHFLDPDIILAMANDPNMQASIEAMTESMFDSGFDPDLAEIMADSCAGNATDASYWESFMSDGAFDEEKLGNFEEFLNAEIDSGAFADVLSGDSVMQWGDFLDNVDLTQDWGAMDASALTAQFADDFSACAVELDANSCQYQCGGFTGSCSCDDACDERGDCCSDKVYECGESYLLKLMNQYGVDLGSTAFELVSADADSDGDGVADVSDNCPIYYNVDQTDTDSDGQGDACQDSDQDGTIDLYDNCPSVANPDQMNTDYWADSSGNACDTDADGDDVLDSADDCPTAYNPAQTDQDSDGVGDACDGRDTDGDGWIDLYDNCTTVDNADQINSDYWHDSEGDACDDDDDGDDIADITDNCPITYNSAQTDTDGDDLGDACDGSDSDADGYLDTYDNCPTQYNPDQVNTDGDSDGDACDNDDDGDSVADTDDNCRTVSNVNQADSDSNGVGNSCDGLDSDWDGYPDESDNCPTMYNPDQDDADSDGTGNVCDTDYTTTPGDPSTADLDADGAIGSSDNCPLVSNADQADTDGDGWGDSCDNCASTSNADQADEDNDGTGDVCETSPSPTPTPSSSSTPDPDPTPTPSSSSTPSSVSFAGSYSVSGTGPCVGESPTLIDSAGNEGSSGSTLTDRGDSTNCIYHAGGEVNADSDSCTYAMSGDAVTSITWTFTSFGCNVTFTRL